MIEKFIEENLPHISDGNNVSEEFLNKDRFRDAIDDFLFIAKTPKISDTLKLLEVKPKLTERNNIGRRIIQKVQNFVDVFFDGVNA